MLFSNTILKLFAEWGAAGDIIADILSENQTKTSGYAGGYFHKTHK